MVLSFCAVCSGSTSSAEIVEFVHLDVQTMLAYVCVIEELHVQLIVDAF